MNKSLGRIHLPDARDLLHLASPRPLTAIGRRQQFWYTPPAFDQGETTMCVAYSGMKFLESAPVTNRPSFDFNWLYKECQLNDEIPGEDYDGTTVRALFKILTREGYISGYHWAYDVPTVAAYLLTTGPMVIGSLWTEDMFYPDRRGFIHVGSGIRARQHGGHAYLVKGVNLDTVCSDGTKGAFRIINSWGKCWGVNGCASISFADMALLLGENGEGCAAKEILK